MLSTTGTMMCYGQTGAGKTFTMCGATESYQHRGIIPRSISQLFRDIEERPEFAITCRFVLLKYIWHLIPKYTFKSYFVSHHSSITISAVIIFIIVIIILLFSCVGFHIWRSTMRQCLTCCQPYQSHGTSWTRTNRWQYLKTRMGYTLRV